MSLPTKPLLPGFFQVVPMGADAVQLRSVGRVIRLAGPGLGEIGPRVLAALDGRSTIAELSQELDVDVASLERLVGRLHDDGVVADADVGGAADPNRANPVALEFYGELRQRADAVHEAISASRVAVLGLGPVARLAARHLASAGVGRLALIDAGFVTVIDQAVIAAPGATLGRPRTAVTAEECRSAVTAPGAEQFVTVAGESLPGDLLDQVDLVVLEVDESGQRAEAANAACLAAGVPFLLHRSTTLEVTVGPAVAPFRSPCHRCVEQRRVAHLRYYDEYVAYQQELRDGRLEPREAALLAGCAAMAAGLVSMEVIRVLGGFAPAATAQGVLVADFTTLEVRREEVLPVPDCPACGSREEHVELQP